MIFFGNGVVWDVEFNKPLCKFIEGKYETEDARTCDILKRTHLYTTVPEIVIEEFEEVKEYKCSSCDFISKSFGGLKSHEINKHKDKKR